MNQRDLELLSSYLDGQLASSDSIHLESRLKTDAQLVSALDDLRAARTLLRKLPQRRAPRNFTLTRNMVGLNPPLPRSYPAFRFVTAIATLLFFFTFGLNSLAPQFSTQTPYFGFGGGGGPETFSAQAPALEAAPAAEAPAATEAPAAADIAPQPTAIPPSEDSARNAETPATKVGEAANAGVQNQPQAESEAQQSPSFVPSVWLTVFGIIALLGSIFMAAMRRSSINRWR